MTWEIDNIFFLKCFFMLSAFKEEEGIIMWRLYEHILNTELQHYDAGIHRKTRLTLISFRVYAIQKKYSEFIFCPFQSQSRHCMCFRISRPHASSDAQMG